MLDGITFWTDDAVWRHILTDLGAEFAEKQFADVIFTPDPPTQDLLSGKAASKSIPPPEAGAGKYSPAQLKAEALRQIDARENEIIKKVCPFQGMLSGPQKKVIISLYRAGSAGLNAEQLQQQLGYAPGATTNAANTAIYQLRKIFGKEFIKNDDGKYRLK